MIAEEQELYREIQTLSNDIRFLKDEVAYLNRRLLRHQYTAHSTYGRVFLWSLIQMVILVGVVYFQVSYLKKFFEKRRLV